MDSPYATAIIARAPSPGNVSQNTPLGSKDKCAALLFLVEQANQQGKCFHAGNSTSRKRLIRMAENGKVVRTFRSLYALSAWWTKLNEIEQCVCLARTLAEIHPEWVFCGPTAAAILGFSPPYSSLRKIHVALEPWVRHRDSDGICFHRMQDFDVITVNGVRVTSAARTAFDCIRTLPFSSGLAVADAATRAQGWDNLHLWRYVIEGGFGRMHGISRARLVALLADGQSESGGESIARANMIREGFLMPKLQVKVHAPSPETFYRVDFAWFPRDKQPIFGELDGRAKYVDAEMLGTGDTLDVLLRERRRESDLTLASASIVRFSYQEAASRHALARRLNTFSVPRVTDALTLTSDSRHNMREIRRYLVDNLAQGADVDDRLDELTQYMRQGNVPAAQT